MQPVSAVNGWTIIAPIAGDGSSRRYFRVQRGSQLAVMMDCSGKQTHGHALSDFVRIDHWLHQVGLKVPQIFELDEDEGYAVLEDFGDISFKKAMVAGQNKAQLYALAHDALKYMQLQPCDLELPAYYKSHVHDGRRFVIDWFAPLARKAQNPDGALDAYLKTWAEIEETLPECPAGFMHIDYHVENLMWLPDESNLARCGILDFQGAMHGPLAYDVANLLEDPRYEIDQELRDLCLSEYDETFRAWYRVLATQFHCRVIGQFIRLAYQQDKKQYLEYLPRTAQYILEALENPILAPLKAYFYELALDFEAVSDLNMSKIALYVRDDAY